MIGVSAICLSEHKTYISVASIMKNISLVSEEDAIYFVMCFGNLPYISKTLITKVNIHFSEKYHIYIHLMKHNLIRA